MKILILSPLFPPDIGDPASYTKNLATQLSKKHEVTVLIYGYLPEQVPAQVHSVDKRSPQISRLFAYTRKLFALAKDTDLIIVNNGPSVELPVFVWSFFNKKPYVYCESDALAVTQTTKFLGILSSRVKQKASKSIMLPTTRTYDTPELLPFTQNTRSDSYSSWWTQHLSDITHP